MNFKNIYDSFAVSFEVFPPKTDEGTVNLYKELEKLTPSKPAFISVTYGAGGSTQDKTIDIALEIRKRFGIQPLVHFTCVGSGRADINIYLDRVKSLGLTDILALRGDPPKGETDFRPAPDGFAHGNELVKFISDHGGFSIVVAGYPEGHPDCESLDQDFENLKRKADSGADVIITQFFFNNDDYLRLRDRLAKAGNSQPLIPGILPITTISQLDGFIPKCGAKVPSQLDAKLRAAKSPDDCMRIGVEYAINQCETLRKEGAKGLHLYPLNKAYPMTDILRALGLI